MQLLKKYPYVLTLFIIIGLTFTFLHIKSTNEQTNLITVSNGDSLWTLASQYVDQEERVHWIDSVMQMNFMTDSQIKVGQQLTIPSDVEFDYLGEPTQLAGSEQ